MILKILGLYFQLFRTCLHRNDQNRTEQKKIISFQLF